MTTTPGAFAPRQRITPTRAVQATAGTRSVSEGPAAPGPLRTATSPFQQLLRAIRRAGEPTVHRLFEELYGVIVADARRVLAAEGRRRPIEVSELVSLAYLRLYRLSGREWQDEHHFRRVTGRAMRRALVDLAREGRAAKRGGRVEHLTLRTTESPEPIALEQVIDLDRALVKLAGIGFAREAQVLEMAFFGGMSQAEIAGALGIATRTVQRDWGHARVWLAAEIGV